MDAQVPRHRQLTRRDLVELVADHLDLEKGTDYSVNGYDARLKMSGWKTLAEHLTLLNNNPNDGGGRR